MAGAERLEELDLSADEVERLRRAFRDERFRQLLADYAAELADPAQRQLYEQEVTALERERGVDVRFVHPTAGYVLRTSQDGTRRCYLNVCSNPLVGAPEPRAEPGGLRWALPYCLAPGREELGRGGRRLLLYDVVFHPAALRMAARSARFRRLLSDTALEAVERRFAVRLDRANAALLRGATYKGVPQAPVIRSPLPGGAPPPPDGDSPLPPFPYPCPAAPPPPPPADQPPAAAAGPTTPRWSLRQRSYVELQDYRCCRDAAPSPVPRELVLSVELPLLRSAAGVQLEVRGRELRLDSRRPAYRLRLRLPYAVDESAGRAAFRADTRQLVVTLPVVPRPARPEPPGGAEAEAEAGGTADPVPEPPPSPSGSEEPPPASAESRASPSPPAAMAPGAGCAALCPPFQCRQDEASVTLLLQVPGIVLGSLRGDLGTHHYELRFSSAAAAYALFLQFCPPDALASAEPHVDVSADNAAVTLAKAPGSTGPWEKLRFGLDAASLQERLFVSEDNVDGFLDTVLCPSLRQQPAAASRPLIEVLDITEDKSHVRLQPQEAAPSEPGTKEQGDNGPERGAAEEPEGTELQTVTEAAGTVAEEEAAESSPASSSAAAAGTAAVACASPHRSRADPPAAASAEGSEPDPRVAAAAGWGARAGGGSARGRPASPELREVSARDGSERRLGPHATRCPLALQSALLYELD
ncbi:protein kintoun [Eudromia elegans]